MGNGIDAGLLVTPLRTQRCILRQWREDDLALFAEMNADPEVVEFFPSALTSEQSDAFARRNAEAIERDGHGLWALEVEGRFAGFVGLNRTAFDTPMGEHLEIGWRLARWAWGKGYASEAARAVLDFAFNELKLSEVFSFTTEKNVRSEAVMKRIGGVRRPDLDFDHPNTVGWWGQRHIVYRFTPASA